MLAATEVMVFVAYSDRSLATSDVEVGIRIFIYTDPTDMRKSFNGLSGLVKEHFQVDLFSGHLFVLFNRKRDYFKILMWDNDGLSLWSKRVDQ